jgi:hypothetical protein
MMQGFYADFYSMDQLWHNELCGFLPLIFVLPLFLNDYSALKSNCGDVELNLNQDQIRDEKVNVECYKNITLAMYLLVPHA